MDSNENDKNLLAASFANYNPISISSVLLVYYLPIFWKILTKEYGISAIFLKEKVKEGIDKTLKKFRHTHKKIKMNFQLFSENWGAE